MTHTLTKKLILVSAVLLCASIVIAGGLLYVNNKANAADARNFNPENIISDYVFTDSDSMSASQIQNFLNNKNSTCLKNFKTLSLNDQNRDGLGDEPYGKGKNEKVSAATLIWQAAQLYRINPKVILATLQKEQGLITRTDCPAWRYNTALGYGCPDTAPCDDNAYGFTRQIDYGVWHFRGFYDDTFPVPPTIPGKKFIAYNPSSSCGGKTITIRNKATAALYSYTPYQPNAATLAAPQGTTVSCGAYGNLNFWYYFTNWFGPTQGTPFFRVADSNRIYIEGADNRYYYMSTSSLMEAYGYGKEFKMVQNVASSYVSSKTFAGNASYFARFEADPVYFLSQGLRYHASSREIVETYGYTLGQETLLPESLSTNLSESQPVTDILAQADRSEIYLISGGQKHHISTPNVYKNTGTPIYASRPYAVLDSAFAATIPTGAPILDENSFVQSTDTKEWWIYITGSLYPIDKSTAEAWGVISDYSLPTSIISQMPKSSEKFASVYLKTTTGKTYLIDTKRKILLNQEQQTSLRQPTYTNPIVSETLLNKFKETSFPSLVRQGIEDTVYSIQSNGELYAVYARDDLDYYKMNITNVVSLNNTTISLFKNTGKILLKDGRLVRINNEDTIYIVDGKKRHPLPTRQIFNAYGYDINKTISFTPDQLAAYENSTPLSRYLAYHDGSRWLVDNGKRYKFTESLLAVYGLESADFNEASEFIITSLPQGQTLTTIVSNRAGSVYEVKNGKKIWFPSRKSFERNHSWSEVRYLSDEFLAHIPTASAN